MNELCFDEALDFYCRTRDRLPAIPVRRYKEPTEIDNVATILNEFDVVLLDAWGVLNAGDSAIPGAVSAVAEIKRRGLAALVVSNDASSEKFAMVKKHRMRGFPFDANDIVATQELLSSVVERFPAVARWGIIAYDGWPVTSLGEDYALLRDSHVSFDGFIFLSAFEWSEPRQAALAAALRQRPRPLVVANPDIVAPDEHGRLIVKPGYFAHRLADEAGIAPVFLGKPFPEIFERARTRFPLIPADRFLMVGDTLHTDIIGAQAAGMKTLLLTHHGFLKGQNWRAICARTGVFPDFVAPAL
jgi:glycerol 3-phosphatase-2